MQNNKKIYAVTGGIGCGKTAVSQIIRRAGYTVFSCDEIYAELLEDGNFVARIERAVGKVTSDDGSLDRKKLAAKVFSDADTRRKLNEETHPVIMEELFRRAHCVQGSSVFCEVPLLFENGFEKLFDGVIVVLRSLKGRIRAVMERSDLTEEQVRARIAAQYDYSALSGDYYIIENDGGLEQLQKKVLKILQKIT